MNGKQKKAEKGTNHYIWFLLYKGDWKTLSEKQVFEYTI